MTSERLEAVALAIAQKIYNRSLPWRAFSPEERGTATLAASAALAAADAWLPVETVPLGERVFLWFPGMSIPQDRLTEGACYDDGSIWTEKSNHASYHDELPTLWRPMLPLPTRGQP